MKRIVFGFVIVLIAISVGCEKTIKEPGEQEHGGVFLHASPDVLPTSQE